LHGIGGESMAIDSQWANVSLLLPFSEDMINVKGHPATPVGGAALSSAVGNPFGAGKSLYLDGVDDHLTIVTSSDLVPGSSDLTIECWIYRTISMASGTFRIVNSWDGQGYILAIVNNNVYFSCNNGTSYAVTGGATTINTWHYVVAKRVGSVLSVAIGTSETTGTVSGSIPAPVATYVGRASDGASQYFTGYISDIRVTMANRTTSVIPSTPFSRPTIRGVVLDSSVAPVAKTILVQDRSTQRVLGGVNSDATTGIYTFRPWDFGECIVTRLDELFDPMTDECVFNLDPAFSGLLNGAVSADSTGRGPVHTTTFNGNARISADGRAFDFDGTGDSIQSASSWYILALEDFDISLEFFPIAGGHGSADAMILQLGPSSTLGTIRVHSFSSTNPARIVCYFYNGSSNIGIGDSNPTTYANNTWHKLRLRRVNGVFYLEMNGTLVSTSAATAYNISANQLAVGANTANGENFYGKIGKVRISRGPIRANASISNALLLAGPSDGSSGENALIYDRVIPGG
jgi:hypothetical protein